jgi:hypothetical protein
MFVSILAAYTKTILEVYGVCFVAGTVKLSMQNTSDRVDSFSVMFVRFRSSIIFTGDF